MSVEDIVKAAKKVMQDVTETAEIMREIAEDGDELGNAHETGGRAVLDAVLKAAGVSAEGG